MPKLNHPENPVQIAIATFLRMRGFTFTSTQGGLFISNLRSKALLKSMGYRKGVSDMIVFVPNGTICIEVKKPAQYRWNIKLGRLVKAEAAGTQSPEQKVFEKEVTAIAGHTYIVATTVNDVEEYFREHNIQPR